MDFGVWPGQGESIIEVEGVSEVAHKQVNIVMFVQFCGVLVLENFGFLGPGSSAIGGEGGCLSEHRSYSKDKLLKLMLEHGRFAHKHNQIFWFPSSFQGP